MNTQPLVSCIMPTADRRRFVPLAVEYFLRQDYEARELIVADDGVDAVQDLMPADARVRYIRLDKKRSVGAKRNLACEQARGEIIVHWDDDDWMAPGRVREQVGDLLRHDADICGIDRVLFFNPATSEAWEYCYPENARPWVYGASLCYRRDVWRRQPFPEIQAGEDARFVWAAQGRRIHRLADNRCVVAIVHADNTSPKQTHDPRYHPQPLERVREILGSDWAKYASGAAVTPAAAHAERTALVSAAYGIGDLVRMTPLVRVLHRLGYRVDLLLAPDCAAATTLLEGAPEVRRVFHYRNFRENRGSQPVPELAGARYNLAVFTTWSGPLQRWVQAERCESFPRADWLSQGDSACISRIARDLGWNEALPAAFAVASERRFDLPPGTVALHPGCKPDWPWKKWHGFDELARLLPQVVVVGSEADLDNSQTYFGKSFDWPQHARNFVGRLSLADTAALISQCAALVSNDSGLMHLGVALAVPTFGIFGITSPQREMLPSRWMIPVTKGLSCEEPCRRREWGRRDCDQHLECLKTLTPAEVAARIHATLPSVATSTSRPPKVDAAERIRINYYSAVFDASGYGQAARAYIHALHRVGIQVSVVDLGAQPPQVEDGLARSLLGHDKNADFQLFHGIPPYWARMAYPLRNVIAMTVWETDTMPQQWRNPLTHAIDVWLPCSFNVEVFSRGLSRIPFCLPHALPARGVNGAPHSSFEPPCMGFTEDDFVYYSIFEWQDRKNPKGMIDAFLRAFPEECDAVLAIKTNPGASTEVTRMLKGARAMSGSRGRVRLHCEAWSDMQVHALHQRGDCYVSLHKGEGWGYPLFEAACRGKPVVATAYAGPLDYLDPQRHWLVRQSRAPVRQHYAYYHPRMNWAEPDIAHASEGMQWIYEHRDDARLGAAQAAQRLRAAYSLEQVGAVAKGRLLELLKHANPAKGTIMQLQNHDRQRPTVVPISGDWYDADYFEHGLKSNWDRGYSWPLFKGIFESTAAYLAEMFPEARTFLDIGCAKGFLVKALREKGLECCGFDHSPWALSQAEPAAKPFVQLADIETVSYDRQFDVLVAMSIFESLTEDQLRRFLLRARSWTQHALFATICTLDMVSRNARPAADRDLSHITLRSRDWWRERFFEAGWRQDPMHRVFERLCQNHSLPVKMGWNVYVFAPGR